MINTEQRHAGLAPSVRADLMAVRDLLNRQQLERAAGILRRATTAAPQHAEVLRLNGLLAYHQRRAADALEPLHQALRQQPDDDLISVALGACHEALGDDEGALAAYEMACKAGPQQPLNWVNVARMLGRTGRIGQAVAALRHALRLAPQHRPARMMLAGTLALAGHGEAAAAEYRQLVRADPGNGRAWWGLAIQKPMPLRPDDLATMQAALRTPQLGIEDRQAMCFALALGLEAAGDIEAAWRALVAAHDVLADGQQRWDAAGFERALAEEAALFETLPRAAPDDPGREVIFIVSLPRSGSTLVEQILASHSAVAGTSELAAVGQTLTEASNRFGKPYPQWVPECDSDAWHVLGRRYLERTAHWRRERPRMTDKMPNNWPHLGAILRMLPNARIIAVRRDPLETCLACWRMLLPGHGYTHRFEDLAAFRMAFERTVTTWQARCPQRVKVVDYEALTAHPEAGIRDLLAFCDLPFEPACLVPHQSNRRVTTMSAAQVREPIHAARPRVPLYGARLDPLRRALNLPTGD